MKMACGLVNCEEIALGFMRCSRCGYVFDSLNELVIYCPNPECKVRVRG